MFIIKTNVPMGIFISPNPPSDLSVLTHAIESQLAAMT